jgi:branched-chain amino acid transport system permease protein
MTTEAILKPFPARSVLATLAPKLAIVLLIATLFAVPSFVESTYALHMMILIFINVIVGSSWNILGGYTGQYSVGHSAYFGVGAYTVMSCCSSSRSRRGGGSGPDRWPRCWWR